MKSFARIVVLLSLSAAILAAASFAGTRQQMMSALRTACKADVQRLCSDVSPGHGALKQCIKNHASELSDGCRQALAQAKQAKQQNSGQ